MQITTKSWRAIPLTIGMAVMLSLAACEQRETAPPQTRGEREATPPLGYVEPGTGGEAETIEFTGERGEVAIERTGPEEARQGQLYRYEIRVTNTSDVPVHNVVVTEVMPAGLEIERSVPQFQPVASQAMQQQQLPPRNQQQQQQPPQLPPNQQQPQQQSPLAPGSAGGAEGELQQQQRQQQPQQNTIAWQIGLLNPGESRTIEVFAVPVGEGTMQSCLSVTYDPVVCAQVRVVSPELRFVAEAPSAVYICDDIPVRMRVMNVGTGSTAAGRITFELPEGLTTADGERQIATELEELSAGDEAERELNLRATRAGQYTFRAAAETGEGQVQSSRIQVLVYDPELNLNVSGPRQVYLGSRASYEVMVNNPGDVPVMNAVLQVDAGDDISRFDVGAGDLDFEDNQVAIGRLEPGESRRFYVAFEGNRIGATEVLIAARGRCVDAVTRAIATEFVGIPAIRIQAFDRIDPVPVGETTLYEVRVTNQGSAADLDVQLQATLPEQMEFISAEGQTQVQAQGRQLNFGPLRELAPGDVAVWMIRARAVQPGSARFQVQMTSDANPQPVTAMEPTTLFSGESPIGQQRQQPTDEEIQP